MTMHLIRPLSLAAMLLQHPTQANNELIQLASSSR